MGRSRRSGQRTKSGRLSRAVACKRDAGTDQAQKRRSQFKGNGYDAIGRAYEHGLLGEEGGRVTAEAKVLLDMARSLNRAYWCEYEVGHEGCTLGKHGASTMHFGPPIRGLDDPEQERWLNKMLGKVRWWERSAFDDLVLNHYPDQGPVWLDRIIAGIPRRADLEKFSTALEVLRRISVDRIGGGH